MYITKQLHIFLFTDHLMDVLKSEEKKQVHLSDKEGYEIG